jgi:hypothetical protein
MYKSKLNKYVYKMQYGSGTNSNLELNLKQLLERIPRGSITINDTTVTYDKISESIEDEIDSLLRKGVDLNKTIPNERFSILQWLVMTNNRLILYILLKLSGYNPQNLNYQYEPDNKTLLMMACITNNISITQILLFNNRCDVNLLNNSKQSALDIATDPTLKQLLIKYGAKLPVVYNSPGEKCAICEDVKDNTVKTGINRVAKITPCGHTFHFGCIIEARKHSNLCPLCRGHIDSIEVFY